MVLVAVWIAGRLGVTFSAETGWLPAMLIDASFLLLVALAAAREIVAGRNWRNLAVVMLVLLLLAGNIAFHLEAHFHGSADIAIRAGIAVVVLLIALIGGRIVPSFTRNWLVRENPGRLPVPFGRFDTIVVAIGALALVAWVVSPTAVSPAPRSRSPDCCIWCGSDAGRAIEPARERLLLILHVGYFFVPLGFLLNAAAAFAAGAGKRRHSCLDGRARPAS